MSLKIEELNHQQLLPYFSGFAPFPPELAYRFLPEARPRFVYPKGGSETLIICLHGFTGTPYEVVPAVDGIALSGIAAVAPLLPGHGYRERQDQERCFSRITMEGMLDAVRQEITQARTQFRRVGIVGLSMGGAIALTMAAEGRVDACAVAAPALRLPLKAEILIPLLSWASFTMDVPIRESFYLPGYEFFHSWSLRALWQLSRHARKSLAKINCPVLAIHSQNDLSVPPIVLDLMEARIPHPIDTAWFNRSGHSMLLDVSGAEVTSMLVEFLECHLKKA